MLITSSPRTHPRWRCTSTRRTAGADTGTATDEQEALLKAEEKFKNETRLPKIGFWIKPKYKDSAIEILNNSSIKL